MGGGAGTHTWALGLSEPFQSREILHVETRHIYVHVQVHIHVHTHSSGVGSLDPSPSGRALCASVSTFVCLSSHRQNRGSGCRRRSDSLPGSRSASHTRQSRCLYRSRKHSCQRLWGSLVAVAGRRGIVRSSFPEPPGLPLQRGRTVHLFLFCSMVIYPQHSI